MEGTLNLPGNRVTVGRNGQVAANITAREIVVLGKVKGNVSATDRVDIRAEGSLNGDVAAARISIEDGAFFKGGIDIRKPDAKPDAKPAQGTGTTPGRSPRADAGDTLSANLGWAQVSGSVFNDRHLQQDTNSHGNERLCLGRGVCASAAE